LKNKNPRYSGVSWAVTWAVGAFIWLFTAAGAKSYIFETKLHGKTIRTTIGDWRTLGVGDAQKKATKLKADTGDGIDPRQVIADAIAAKEAQAAALSAKDVRESVTVAEAWQAYFVAPGGVKRKSGRRTGEPETTRLADLDAKVIKAWLDKEAPRTPTIAGQAFRYLRAFLNWCSRQDGYKSAVHADACQVDEVKKLVPSNKTKPNDSLRKAQIKPWFEAVRKIGNPVIAAYLQGLLLTGARRNELATLRWANVDFQWKSLTIHDKVEGERTIPLTPYLEHLIVTLPRRNEFVFSSPTSASGSLEEPRIQHNKALTAAALPPLSLHGLRRSFGTLSEWVEVPAGIVAQIMGHKPSAIAEKHYIQRELDLLHFGTSKLKCGYWSRPKLSLCQCKWVCEW
jgi:integrase